MSDSGVPEEDPAPSRPTLLTPQATSVVAIVLACFSLMGQGTWTTAVQVFFGTVFRESQYADVLTWNAVASLVVSLGGVYFARLTVTARRGVIAWDIHLARAAMVIAGIGAVFAAATLVGSLVVG